MRTFMFLFAITASARIPAEATRSTRSRIYTTPEFAYPH